MLLMVKAGDQVDVEIAGLVPHLAAGEIVIDGGNSHYRDTGRRARDLERRGIGYLGLGPTPSRARLCPEIWRALTASMIEGTGTP